MITDSMNRFLDNAFPVTGGGIGALLKVDTLIVSTNIVDALLECAGVAFVGSLVGYLVKLGMDYIVSTVKKKRAKS